MKRKMMYLVVVAYFILMSLTKTAYGGQLGDDSKVVQLSERMDQQINTIINEGKSVGAVATMVVDGEKVLSKGYGFADVELGVESNGKDVGFRIGSISKTFVAVAALIAVEEGYIDMDQDIAIYLEGDQAFKPLKYPVTMHHLLTHTSGFEEIVSGMAVKNVSDTEPLSETIVKYRPKQIYRPGEIASYSNYGIGLAAYVIEKSSGIDFADFCYERIFKPLEMDHTTFAHMHDTVRVSQAYLPNGQVTMDMYMNIYPEGSAVSTADDMAKYIQWLLEPSNRILSQTHKAELLEQQFSMADEFEGIGYVWNRKEQNGHLYFDKKGETLHFYSRILLYPEKKTGIFYSFNTYVPSGTIDGISKEVTRQLYGEQEAHNEVDGATYNVGGCYVNLWLSQKTPEKILRFFVPGKMVDVSGSLSDGFTLNDEKMVHLGNNVYETTIGKVKFFSKNGETYMTTAFSQTYERINGLENQGITFGVSILFILITFLYGMMAFIKRKDCSTIYRVARLVSFFQLVSLAGMIVLLIYSMMNFNVLAFAKYIHMAGWMIATTTLLDLLNALRVKPDTTQKGIYIVLWCHVVISIGFCFVMWHLNLLG
jgi:CubicO group peptidase (beta-lactamase class C family)